jgi:hypothetical protein
MSASAVPVSTALSGVVSTSARFSGNPYRPGGVLTVRHREYLGELVTGTGAFTIQASQINPGAGATTAGSFPLTWLNRIARNFNNYSFESLRYVVSTELPTNTAGSIMMAVNPDVADTAPTSKVQLMNLAGAVRCAPWQDCILSVSPSVLKQYGKRYVIADTAPAGSQDPKTIYVGNLFLASQGFTSSTAAEVYADYVVHFSEPTPAVLVDAPVLPPVAFQQRVWSAYSDGIIVADQWMNGSATIFVAGTGWGPLGPVTLPATNVLSFSTGGVYFVARSMTGFDVTSGPTFITDPLNACTWVNHGADGAGFYTDLIRIVILNPGTVEITQSLSVATFGQSLIRVFDYNIDADQLSGL